MAAPHLGLRCWLCEDAAIHECSTSCRHRYAYLAVYGRIGFCGDCCRLIGVQAVGERWWRYASRSPSAKPAKGRTPALVPRGHVRPNGDTPPRQLGGIEL